MIPPYTSPICLPRDISHIIINLRISIVSYSIMCHRVSSHQVPLHPISIYIIPFYFIYPILDGCIKKPLSHIHYLFNRSSFPVSDNAITKASDIGNIFHDDTIIIKKIISTPPSQLVHSLPHLSCNHAPPYSHNQNFL